MKQGLPFRGPTIPHALILTLAASASLAAMWGGLLRIGWNIPTLGSRLAANHGALMVSGFLGTLIGLERAIALSPRFQRAHRPRRPRLLRHWPYGGPALSGIGALLIAADVSTLIGAALITLGSALMVITIATVLHKGFAWFILILALGAAAWLVGNLLWLMGLPVYKAAPWWICFLVFTIAAERLELGRLLGESRVRRAVFAFGVTLFSLGCGITPFQFQLGMSVLGAGALILAGWLLRNDVSRKTIRRPGLTRYIAVSILGGHLWLGVGGALALSLPVGPAGSTYDAVLHTFFLGFTFSMIFGHAPIILPAITGITPRYTPAFYLHLAALHLSLAMRLAGDLTLGSGLRRWGAMLNVVALMIFLLNTILAARRGERAPTPQGGPNSTSDDPHLRPRATRS
jgi:hypothetical protein